MLRRPLRRPIGRGLVFVGEHAPLLRVLNAAYVAAPPRWQAPLNDGLPNVLKGLRRPDLGTFTRRSRSAGRSIFVPLLAPIPAACGSSA